MMFWGVVCSQCHTVVCWPEVSIIYLLRVLKVFSKKIPENKTSLQSNSLSLTNTHTQLISLVSTLSYLSKDNIYFNKNITGPWFQVTLPTATRTGKAWKIFQVTLIYIQLSFEHFTLSPFVLLFPECIFKWRRPNLLFPLIDISSIISLSVSFLTLKHDLLYKSGSQKIVNVKPFQIY